MWTERTYEARISPMKQTNIRYLLAHAGPVSWKVQGQLGEPSTLKANIMDGSGAIGRTLHAERQDHGRFRDTVTQILHMEVTAGRQEGPFRSPTQSCRSVAAGGHIEATEKGPHNLRI